MMDTNAHTSREDHERQVESQLDDLEVRLVTEYGGHPDADGRVREVLTGLRESFTDARIKAFLPILIERAARAELITAR